MLSRSTPSIIFHAGALAPPASVLAASVLLSFASIAATSVAAPADWKTLTDKSGVCHIAVPGDWQIKSGGSAMATAPGGYSVTLTHMPEQVMSYEQARSVGRKNWERSDGFAVQEESGRRTVYVQRTAQATHWSVFNAGPPLCHSMIAAARGDDPLAQQIVASFK